MPKVNKAEQKTQPINIGDENKTKQKLIADLRIAVGWGAIECDLTCEEKRRLKNAQDTLKQISALEIVPILIMLTSSTSIPIRPPVPYRESEKK